MILNDQKINFIYKYLTNSGIKYEDVKVELTDHIATAVEDIIEKEQIEFIDAFKKYMLSNKKDLFSRVGFSFNVVFEDLLYFIKKLYSSKNLMIACFILIFCQFTSNNNIHFLNNLCLYSFGFMSFIIRNIILRKKYFIITKLEYLMLMFYLINIIFFGFPSSGSLISEIFILYFEIIFIIHYFKCLKVAYSIEKYSFFVAK